MDKTFCKVCQHKHHLNSPHIFPDTSAPESKLRAVVREKKTEPAAKKPIPAVVDSGSSKKPVKRWDKESWNAYMKEYMRKRRAEGKA